MRLTGVTLNFIIIAIATVIQFFIARAIAKYAAKKGLNYNLYFWLSFLVSWLIMLIVALAAQPTQYEKTNDAISTSDNP